MRKGESVLKNKYFKYKKKGRTNVWNIDLGHNLKKKKTFF